MRNLSDPPWLEPASSASQCRSLPWGFGLALWLFLSAAFAADTADTENPAVGTGDGIPIEFQDGRISLSAEQEPIVELMQLVGDKAGFEVTSYGDFTRHRVSMTLTDVKLADAIKRLLKDTSAIVSYGDSAQAGAPPPIVKIFLLGSSAASTDSNPIRLETVAPDLDNNLRSSEIQSTDAQSRIESIERVAGLGDELTLENLAFSLKHDPDPGVRLKAITAIGEIGGATAVGMLESGLGDDNPQVRKRVVETLGAIRDERVPFWLGQVLMGDPSPEVRLVAVHSIAQQDGDAARIFLEAATGDSSSTVSDTARDLLR